MSLRHPNGTLCRLIHALIGQVKHLSIVSVVCHGQVRNLSYAVLVLLAAGLASGGETPVVAPVTFEPAIRAEQMRPHIEFLASPKLAGRSGAAKAEARRYIVDQWKAAGLRPFHVDPYDDFPHATHERIRSLDELLALV